MKGWIPYLIISSAIVGIVTFNATKDSKAFSISPIKVETIAQENPIILLQTQKLIAQNQQTTDKQHRIALVIGNATYQQGRLRNPINDATDIATALQELGFEVILIKDADLRQMDNALEEFSRKLRLGGVGLFYYAGHGMQVDGENYLIPLNAKLNREQDVRYETFPIGKVLGVMENARSEMNFVILDACRDNPFARQWRSNRRGLAVVSTVRGILIAYATSPEKTADDGAGRNGIYTSSLLQFIKTPNLDVERMFKKVRESVVQETNGRQVPWDSSSLIGEFSFNPINTNTVADNRPNNTVTQSPRPTPNIQPSPEQRVTPINKPKTPNPSPSNNISTNPYNNINPTYSEDLLLTQIIAFYDEGDYQEALRKWHQYKEQEFLDIDNEQAGLKLAESAVELIESEQYQLAFDRAKIATLLAPNLYQAWFLLGSLYLQNKELDKGIDALERALTLAEDEMIAEIQYVLGKAYFYKGDYQTAIYQFQEALKLKPDAIIAWFDIGNVYLKLERYSEAINAYQKVLKQEQKFFPAINNHWLN